MQALSSSCRHVCASHDSMPSPTRCAAHHARCHRSRAHSAPRRDPRAPRATPTVHGDSHRQT
eukprot:1159641-Rhodomonas_salina.1